jgi:L-aspartate oxidase
MPERGEIRRALRKLMWERVGIIRCGDSLGEAREKLLMWGKIIGKNYSTRQELELKNMITVAGIIVKSALARAGSVGAHYRSDFKEKGENWQQHISWNKRDVDSNENTPEKIRKTRKKKCN